MITSPILTGGVLALIGITHVPEGPIDRIFLMTFLTILIGYGPILPLLVIGLSYTLYRSLLRQEFRKWLIPIMLLFTFFGTIGGVVLVFVGNPELLNFRHYSFLMRWANPTVLALPIIAAPLLEKITRSRKRLMFVMLSFALLYAGSIPFTVQAATTMLNPQHETPLSLEPPPAKKFPIFLRDYMLAYPEKSPWVLIGGSEDLRTWTPGLSGRNDLLLYPYMDLGDLAVMKLDRFYVYVPPEQYASFEERAPILSQLVSQARNGNFAIASGFQVESIVFDNNLLIGYDREEFMVRIIRVP
ncbi:MAG: hypothetical protein FJ358_08430 [Thaumarchaeota archaeon]|nr:hypothetical protein [Nitrososphaerota archaeon]